MPTHIPPEIFDVIGDFLHDDRQALLACSLCRELHSSARFHLFYELKTVPRTEELYSLIELLRLPMNTITPYVRRVMLTDLTRCVLLSGTQDVERAAWDILPQVVALLPSLRCLRISSTDFEHVPQDLVRCLTSNLTDFITELEIHDSHFLRFSELVDLICSFPLLKRIELKRLTWMYNGLGPGGVASLRRVSSDVQWHILELRRGSNLNDLAEWLTAHDPPPLLRSLHYDAKSPMEVHHLHALLKKAAPSLRHLQVSFPVFSDARRVRDTLHEFINVTECTSLRSLRYKHILLFPGDAVTSMISPWIAKTLSQIKSDCLQDITFELMLPTPTTSSDETCSCLKELDWNGISTVLLKRQFRYLQSILFRMSPRPGDKFDCTGAAKYILERMGSMSVGRASRRELKVQII